jgi:hypothetical protein
MSDSKKHEIAGINGEEAFTALALLLGSPAIKEMLDISEVSVPGADGRSVTVDQLAAVVQVHPGGVDFGFGEDAMWQIDTDLAHDIADRVAEFERNPQQ